MNKWNDELPPAWKDPGPSPPAWKAPEPSPPAVTDPEPSPPAWKDPEPSPPAWKAPEPSPPALKDRAPSPPPWKARPSPTPIVAARSQSSSSAPVGVLLLGLALVPIAGGLFWWATRPSVAMEEEDSAAAVIMVENERAEYEATIELLRQEVLELREEIFAYRDRDEVGEIDAGTLDKAQRRIQELEQALERQRADAEMYEDRLRSAMDEMRLLRRNNPRSIPSPSKYVMARKPSMKVSGRFVSGTGDVHNAGSKKVTGHVTVTLYREGQKIDSLRRLLRIEPGTDEKYEYRFSSGIYEGPTYDVQAEWKAN